MFNFFKKDQKDDAIRRSTKASYDLTHSKAWPDIQTMFIDKIMEIQSVMNIDDSSPEKAILDMKVRVCLAKELKDILDSIIGASNSYEISYKEKENEETIIQLYDGD